MVVVLVGMPVSILVVMTMRGEASDMKVGTLGVLGWLSHPGPRVRMGERHALGKLHEDQNGRNNTTHHLVR